MVAFAIWILDKKRPKTRIHRFLALNIKRISVPAKDSSTFSFDETLRISDETSVDIFEEV